MNSAKLPKRNIAGLIAVLVLTSAGTIACADAPAGRGIQNIASDIATGVGTVGKTSSTGKKGPIFVFEEYHTSRIGQVQIAAMLVRLYEKHGLTRIGLEGAIQSERPLAGDWFHNAGGSDAQTAGEDVAVRMLGEGEINAAEFMALVFPKVDVHGIELKSQYDVKLDIEGSAQIAYLLKIAEQQLSQADIRKVNELVNQEKVEEAFDYMMSRDRWVREKYEALQDANPTGVAQMAQVARSIRQKARDLGITIEPAVERDMEKTIRFFETASDRDRTMVDYVLALPSVASGAPVAMIVGAGHTDGVIDLLKRNGASFAQITPLSLSAKVGMQTAEQFERKNRQQWARTSLGTLGRLLNADRKPPPVIGTSSARSYASMNMAALLIARTARKGGRVPDEVWASIASLPGLRIDRNSFERDGYDVIFRAWLKDTEDREREVWARVGTQDTQEQTVSLEQKLLQTIADLGGGGKLPPRGPPHNSERTEEEGPGDGKRKVGAEEFVIGRIGSRELAVYAATKDQATRVGRISG